MKTVEEIVMTKAFFELTDQERLQVKDFAENQEDYDKLKTLLSSTNHFFSENKVVASEGMRDHIMEKLYPPTAESIRWYQSVWLFLFPPNKSFFQYPAFQLVGVLVVFIGIFSLWQNPIKKDELAQNSDLNKANDYKESTLLIEEQDEKMDSFQRQDKNEDLAIVPDIIVDKVEEEPIPPRAIQSELKDVYNESESEFFDEEPDLVGALDNSVTPNANFMDHTPLVVTAPSSILSDSKNLRSYSSDQMSGTVVADLEHVAANKQDKLVLEKAKKREKEEFNLVEIQEKKPVFKESRRSQDRLIKNNSVTDIDGLIDLFFEIK